MKKVFWVFVISISFHNGFSQTIEEKIATLACDCLNKKVEITEEIYTNCLGSSMADAVLNDKDPKVRESINTVEGIKSLLEKSDAVLSKSCGKITTKAVISKPSPFYTNSKNELAQNSYIIAKDFMRDQKYVLAIEAFQMALKKDPKFVLALDDIAMCYRQLKDYDNAIKYYKKSLEIYPEGDFALVNIGVVYSLKTDYKTAITYYEKLIKFDPNNAEGFFGAGKNYLALNEDEKALDNIFKAHRIYTVEKSDYIKDTEQIIGAIYQKLKSEKKENLFKKVAEQNDIKIE
ncbi:tetratricopeptide repeat protein [Flavobacterium pectinovorum]|uniref:tetratricopeptide repeat protein n=1 Tax=Flavobacterium pectinovorum TaxID=29533 RepID=UPI001FAE5EB3|nr:tetratricopeptide repeat protein [Flavobacterium pectinovorum]MCI9844447.1 tetratricopeptide repeat protein [Flavobacterium pectinovorum]